MQGEPDPYAVPKSMGIFWMLDSPKNITTTSVAQRIVANHEAYLVFLSFLPLLYLNELNVDSVFRSGFTYHSCIFGLSTVN